MVTRLYLSSTVAADVNPAFESGWTQTTGADRKKCSIAKSNSALTNAVMAGVNGTTLVRQYVSPPMNAQTIAAGTVKGTIRVLESATNDNILQICSSIKVVNRAGDTYGGTAILAKGQYGPSLEWLTSLINRRVADGDATTAVTVNQGDRLVIHVGYYVSSGTSISGSMNFGDDQATDLADNETGTAAGNPFVELSQTIAWEAAIYYKSASITELSVLAIGKGQKRSITITGTSVASTLKKQRRLTSIVETSSITAALKKVYKKTASIVSSSILSILKRQSRRVSIQESSPLTIVKRQRRLAQITSAAQVTFNYLKFFKRAFSITTAPMITAAKRQLRNFSITATPIITVAKKQSRRLQLAASSIVTFSKQLISGGGQIYYLAFDITSAAILAVKKRQLRLSQITASAVISFTKRVRLAFSVTVSTVLAIVKQKILAHPLYPSVSVAERKMTVSVAERKMTVSVAERKMTVIGEEV